MIKSLAPLYTVELASRTLTISSLAAVAESAILCKASLTSSILSADILPCAANNLTLADTSAIGCSASPADSPADTNASLALNNATLYSLPDTANEYAASFRLLIISVILSVSLVVTSLEEAVLNTLISFSNSTDTEAIAAVNAGSLST